MKPSSTIMWAVETVNPRSSWINPYTVRLLRKDAISAWVDLWNKDIGDKLYKKRIKDGTIRLVKVRVVPVEGE